MYVNYAYIGDYPNPWTENLPEKDFHILPPFLKSIIYIELSVVPQNPIKL
jgi:hypothetical protein